MVTIREGNSGRPSCSVLNNPGSSPQCVGLVGAGGSCNYKEIITNQFAHSTVKCNGQISGAEENLARGLVAEYLSGARVEFVLDPLDIGIGQNREVGTFWEVLPEEAVSVFVEAAFHE